MQGSLHVKQRGLLGDVLTPKYRRVIRIQRIYMNASSWHSSTVEQPGASLGQDISWSSIQPLQCGKPSTMTKCLASLGHISGTSHRTAVMNFKDGELGHSSCSPKSCDCSVTSMLWFGSEMSPKDHVLRARQQAAGF